MTRKIVDHAGYAAEFAVDPVSKVKYNGTCGQLGVATALTSVLKLPTDSASLQTLMIDLTRDMSRRGWLTAANGAATLDKLHAEMIAWVHDKYNLTLPIVYYHPFDANHEILDVDEWRPYFQKHAGQYPIVTQWGNGQALVDAVTGKADQPGLQWHAGCDVGYDDGPGMGYIYSDGVAPSVLAGTGFAVYNRDTLIKARISGFIVVGSPLAVAAPTPPARLPQIPVNWNFNNSTQILTGPNGIDVPPQLASFILDNPWWNGNVPLRAAEHHSDGSMSQWFSLYLLAWNPKDGSFISTAGNEYLAVVKQLAAAQSIDPQVVRDALSEITAAQVKLNGLVGGK